MAAGKRSLFLGSFVHCKTLDELETLHDAAVFVDGNGVIVAIEKGMDLKQAEEMVIPQLGWSRGDYLIRESKVGEFFFPGFIDTHIHAPQFPNAGIFGKSTLLDWLLTYTFPMESSFSDIHKAKAIYNRCVKRTLSHGTTTASYYATIHVPATNLLADLCLSNGQRAFIGRCCMDSDLSPESYRDESPQQAIQATRATISHIANIDPNNELITPILTPRFAPSCSRELLASLGALHKETNLPIQTHISENLGELALVKELFPEIKDYATVYDNFGLLTSKTILAHAIHLSDDEMSLIKERNAKISHCPCSNSSITSGTCKVRHLLNQGIDIGLGTDMSGGYSPSILEALRQAVLVSRHVAMGGNDKNKLSIEEVLYLATRGGAKVVDLEGKIGGFEVGMEWDAQLIGFGDDLWGGNDGSEEERLDQSPVDMFGWETWNDRIAKWVYNGDDRNTLAVWVKGRLVHEIKR